VNCADVVVVGAGHAGCEAALAAARLGCSVVLVTLSKAGIGRLSCNPAVGGLGKGHLVREIDALGGRMARVTDRATIQFRRLNTRRGLAVQASRAQVDIDLYPAFLADELRALPGIAVVEGEVVEVTTAPCSAGARVGGVRLADGSQIASRAVVLTTGTFLAAVLHRGEEQLQGGRWGEGSSNRLSESLRSLGVQLGRLKTGTTPRIDAATVDWSRLAVQGDTFDEGHFSFEVPQSRLPRRNCHFAWTNTRLHDRIRSSLHRAPLFTGQIQGRGPRYCPSIEDKVVRFPDRDRHLLFLEPEGLFSPRIYLNGLSTSLPRDLQEEVVHCVEGLEQARILQYGYAVEYDFADPRDLDAGLEHRAVGGLFLAGQVNGTSGYEEAAAQGLVAGVRAALHVVPAAFDGVFPPKRHQAYLGVLVDDLVTRGVGGEPYRMFTSRAEFRLTLREDNADRRLTPLGRALGLVGDDEWRRFESKMEAIDRTRTLVDDTVLPADSLTAAAVAEAGGGPMDRPTRLADLLRRPEVAWATLVTLCPALEGTDPEVAEQIETDIRYAGYIARDEARARDTERLAAVPLPEGLLDLELPGLSVEVRERLRRYRPADLAAVSRLPGITPAAVQVLAVQIARHAALRERER
jgi:tRNA uridine 5-carboxymethylaminomethyl modification enzyme